MPDTSDKELGVQSKEKGRLPVQLRKEPFDDNNGHQHDPHYHSSPSTPASYSDGLLNSSLSLPSGAHTMLVQDLLEDVLSCATSRSSLQHSGEERHLSESTGNPVIPPSNSFTKGKVDDGHTLARNTLNSGATHSASSTTSDTDSSDSDSEDDTILYSTSVQEPEAERDVLLLTKNEQDASKIHIPRPDFVTTEQHTLVKVGTISAVLDDAVVVTTFNLTDAPRQLSDADICNATALDAGSLLCFSDGTVLGAVFETFGPVASPLYIVRFNNPEEIPSVARTGVEVMYVEQEMRLVRGRDVRGKGYDASGKDDEEAYAEEFSDDEIERRAKKKKRCSGADRRAGPLKRARGHGDRHGPGRHEQATKRTEGRDRDRERSQYLEPESTWNSGLTEGAGHPNLRGYDGTPFPSYQRGMSSQPHASMRQPGFPSGMFNSPIPSAGTMPTLYAPGVPPNIPIPMTNSPGPRSALNAILPTANYVSQLSPPAFPDAAPRYAASPMVSQQQQCMYPEPSWGAQENYHAIQHNARHPFTYQQHRMMQPHTGQVSHLEHSQIHNSQDQVSGRMRRSIGEVQVNAAGTNHDSSGDIRLQHRGIRQGFASERYHYAQRR